MNQYYQNIHTGEIVTICRQDIYERDPMPIKIYTLDNAQEWENFAFLNHFVPWEFEWSKRDE